MESVSAFLAANSAVISLIIFAFSVALFIWDKLPMATSAILGCALMVIFGVCDFKTAFGQFASNTVLMLIGVLIVGAAVAETGVAAVIGRAITRVSRGNERVLLAVSFLVAMALSTFMTNVTVLAIFIPIFFALAKDNKNINPLNLVIPLTLAVNMGGVATLAGSSQQMTAQGLLEDYGFTPFKMFDFLPFGLVLGAVALLYCLFVGYPLGKRIWGARTELDSEYANTEIHEIKLEKRKVISVSVIFVLMVFFYIYQKIPFTDIKVPIQWTSTAAALACIITGCISQKKAIASVNWNIVGRLAGCLGIAAALQKGGGIALVGDLFMKLENIGCTPFVLFAILVLIAQLTSLFISNSTAITVTLMIVIAIANSGATGSLAGLNVTAYAMGIVLGSSMGASCPLSGSTWGISMAAGYKFRDYFKYGVGIVVLSYLVILVMVPLLMGLTL